MTIIVKNSDGVSSAVPVTIIGPRERNILGLKVEDVSVEEIEWAEITGRIASDIRPRWDNIPIWSA